MSRESASTVILCYSRTGHSARLARKLEDRTDAGIIAMQAPAYSRGTWGFIRGAFDSIRRRWALPKEVDDRLSAAKCIILCGPVWTSFPATPLRAALHAKHLDGKAVAIFLTSGSNSSGQKALDVAQQDLGRPFVASEVLSNDSEGSERETALIDQFTHRLETATGIRVVV